MLSAISNDHRYFSKFASSSIASIAAMLTTLKAPALWSSKSIVAWKILPCSGRLKVSLRESSLQKIPSGAMRWMALNATVGEVHTTPEMPMRNAVWTCSSEYSRFKRLHPDENLIEHYWLHLGFIEPKHVLWRESTPFPYSPSTGLLNIGSPSYTITFWIHKNLFSFFR